MELLFTVSVAFEALKDACQGPCLENQTAVLKAATRCPSLLEFLGSLNIRTHSIVPSGFFGGERKVHWAGGDPYAFYSTYVRELRRENRLHDDPDHAKVEYALEAWQAWHKR